MGTRTVDSVLRASAVALAVLLFAAPARADRHKGSIGGTGNAQSGSKLYGIGLTGDWTLREGPQSATKGNPHDSDPFKHASWTFSIAGEVTQVAGTHEGSGFSRTALLLGPRFTLNQIGRWWRVEPFAEVLVGPVYQRHLDGSTSVGGSFGAGIDIPFGTLTSTEHHPLVVARVHYGRHWVDDGEASWYDQWTAGLVFRLTRRKN